MGTAGMPRVPRAWYDLPMRALLVCVLMATILEVSTWAGPTVTGIIAVYPISSTSLMLILQPRIGGRATAAVMANSLWGLVGISVGLVALSLSIVSIRRGAGARGGTDYSDCMESDCLDRSQTRCARNELVTLFGRTEPCSLPAVGILRIGKSRQRTSALRVRADLERTERRVRPRPKSDSEFATTSACYLQR